MAQRGTCRGALDHDCLDVNPKSCCQYEEPVGFAREQKAPYSADLIESSVGDAAQQIQLTTSVPSPHLPPHELGGHRVVIMQGAAAVFLRSILPIRRKHFPIKIAVKEKQARAHGGCISIHLSVIRSKVSNNTIRSGDVALFGQAFANYWRDMLLSQSANVCMDMPSCLLCTVCCTPPNILCHCGRETKLPDRVWISWMP